MRLCDAGDQARAAFYSTTLEIALAACHATWGRPINGDGQKQKAQCRALLRSFVRQVSADPKASLASFLLYFLSGFRPHDDHK
jgi:hypothetical protein